MNPTGSTDEEVKNVIASVHQTLADLRDPAPTERDEDEVALEKATSGTPETPTDKSRWRSRRYMLTYAGWVVKSAFRVWLDTLHPNYKHKTIIIAHEIGDKTNSYKHTHVFVDYGRNTEFMGCRIWDFPGPWVQDIDHDPHPNIKKVSITKGRPVDFVMRYISKFDPELADIAKQYAKKEEPALAVAVWGQMSRENVLMMAKRPSDVPGLLTLHKYKPKENELSVREERILALELYPWQARLLEILDGPASDRQILWYFDTRGNTGKSTFLQYLLARDKREGTRHVAFVTQFGGARDGATIIQGAIAGGWDQSILVVDLPRELEDNKIYSPLEMIKNGMMTAVKYEGESIIFQKNPHLVVFANFPPKLNRMSHDRWFIRDITPSSVVRADEITVNWKKETWTPDSPSPPIIIDIDVGKGKEIDDDEVENINHHVIGSNYRERQGNLIADRELPYKWQGL